MVHHRGHVRCPIRPFVTCLGGPCMHARTPTCALDAPTSSEHVQLHACLRTCESSESACTSATHMHARATTANTHMPHARTHAGARMLRLPKYSQNPLFALRLTHLRSNAAAVDGRDVAAGCGRSAVDALERLGIVAVRRERRRDKLHLAHQVIRVQPTNKVTYGDGAQAVAGGAMLGQAVVVERLL